MKNSTRERDILSLVCEMEEHAHAFFCTFGTFQSIVALERRHIERSGQPMRPNTKRAFSSSAPVSMIT